MGAIPLRRGRIVTKRGIDAIPRASRNRLPPVSDDYDRRMNPLRRLVYSSATLPEGPFDLLRTKGLVLLTEGLSGSVAYRHLKMPGHYSQA